MKRFKSIVALLLTVCMVISSSVVPVFAAGTFKITFAAGEEQTLANKSGESTTVYTLKVSANEAFRSLGFVLSYDMTKVQPVAVNAAKAMYVDATPADGTTKNVSSMSVFAKVQLPAYEDDWGDLITPDPFDYTLNEYKIATAGTRKGINVSMYTTEADLSATAGQDIMTFTYRYINGEPSKGDLRLEVSQDSAVLNALGYNSNIDKANGLVVLDVDKVQRSAMADNLDYSFSYVGSDKVTLGSLKLKESKDEIVVNGSLDAANHKVELTLTAKDTDGDVMNLPANTTYEFDAGTTTASLSDDGTTITIPKNSPAGTITVKAASGTVESNEVTIAVTRATSVAAEIDLSEEDVEIDGTAPKTVTASAKDQFGADMTPAWSVSPADQGVSIAADGTITIAADAKADGYEIYANGDEKSETLTVERTSVAKTVVVSGDTELEITDKTGADAEYTAEVKDYFNKTMKAEIEWSVADKVDEVTVYGVTINEDGEMTVPYTAIAAGETGVVIVTAKVNDTVFDTHEIEITKEASKATTIELTGSAISGDTITVNGTDLPVGVIVKDQFDEPILNPDFDVIGATKTADGFTVNGKAADNATITVTSGSASKTLTVDRAASVPASVELSVDSDEIKIGKSATYTVTAKDQFGDDVEVEWSVSGNDKVAVANGTVTVEPDAVVGSTATVTATAGSVSDTLTITVLGKDKLNITEPSETTQTATYDKSAKAFDPSGYDVKDVNGVDFEKEPVITYTDAQGNKVAAPTNAGTYTVTIVWSDDDNYGSKTATLVIDQAEIDASAVAWDYTAPFTYEGTERTVALQNLPEKVEVVYGGTTKATDAGNYTATATLSITDSNYKFKDGTGTVDKCDWEIERAAIVLTPADISFDWSDDRGFVYDGQPKTITLTLSGDYAGMFEIVNCGGNSATDAGKYMAGASIDLKSEYKKNYTWKYVDDWSAPDEEFWEIARKEIAVPTAKTGLVYTGTEQTGVDAGEGYTLTGETATNADSYTATATLDKNHCWTGGSTDSKNISWSIAKAPITVTVTAADKVYDGKTDADLTVVFDGLVNGETVAEGTDYEVTTAAFADKNVGEDKTVNFQIDYAGRFNEIGNYAMPLTTRVIKPACIGTTTADITPADYTVEVADKLDVKVGATNLKSLLPTATATASVAGETINGTLTWDVEDDSVAALKVGGTFTANWTYVQNTDGNYTKEAKTGSTVITIVEGDPQTIAFAQDSVTETYGTLPFTIEANHSVGEGAVSYSSSNPDVATVDAVTGEVTVKGAGTTTITATAAAVPGKWAQATDSYTLTIAPASIDVSGCEWDYESAFTYDGTEKSVALKSVPAGVVASYTDNKATDAGKHTASVSFTTDANHVIAGSVADCNWEIKPAVIELSASDLVWSDTEFEYNGTEKSVTLTIGGEYADMFEVSYVDNAKTDAGEYTAVATLALKAEFDNNYDFTVDAANLQCAWEITRKPIDAPTAKTGLVYNGSAQTGVEAGEGYTLTGNTETNAGTYTATATINSNYKWNDADFDGKIEWTIAKAPAKTFADKTVTAFSNKITSEVQILPVDLSDVLAALGTDLNSVESIVGCNEYINVGVYNSQFGVNVIPCDATSVDIVVTLSSDNYEDSAVTIKVNVIDKTDVSDKLKFEDKTVLWTGDFHYLDEAVFTGTAQGEGSILYIVDELMAALNVPGYIPAGQYTVTARYEDDMQIGEATATLTITNKLDVTVTVTDSKDETFVNNGKYKVTNVENAKDANEAEVIVKGTKVLTAYTSTDASQAADKHKWIGLLIETAVNGEASTNLYYSADGETFEKLDASEFTASNQHGGNGKQFVLWIATDENDEITRWIATDAEGTDALELNIDFTAGGKPSSGSGSGSGTSGSISSSLDEKKAQKVEDMIDEIGRVTLDDEELIEDAREAYDKLTKKQKKLVDNYDELVEAEEKLEELLAAEELPFTDVDANDDIYEAVKFVYDNGLMVGVGDGTMFAPEAGLTRAMIARILHAYEGEPAAAASAFTDVARGMWYTAAIDWAAANKVVSGYGNGLYGPNDTLTREQLAVIMYYYAQSKGYDVSAGLDTNILSYNDAFSISSWAMPAMQWACAEDILTDANGFICPTAAATRADVAEAFMAFMLRYEK